MLSSNVRKSNWQCFSEIRVPGLPWTYQKISENRKLLAKELKEQIEQKSGGKKRKKTEERTHKRPLFPDKAIIDEFHRKLRPLPGESVE